MFARLMVSLLALCFVSELPRLLTFACASPTPHLARPDRLQERGFAEALMPVNPANMTQIIGVILRSIIPPFPAKSPPSPSTPTTQGTAAINQVAHHAAKELQFNLDFDRIHEVFTASYERRDQSGDPATVDQRWIAKQMSEEIPKLKKQFEGLLKQASTPGQKRDVVLALHKNPSDQDPETPSEADLDVVKEALSSYVLEDLTAGNGTANLNSEKSFAARKFEKDHGESPVEAVQKWVNKTFDDIIPDEVRGSICEHVDVEWHRLPATTNYRDVSAWPDKMKKVIGEYWVQSGAYILELYSSKNALSSSAFASSKTSTGPPTILVTESPTSVHSNSSAKFANSQTDQTTTSLASGHSPTTRATTNKIHARQTATADPKVELKDLFWNSPQKRSNGRAHAFDIQGQQARSKASVSRVHAKRDLNNARSFTTLAISPSSGPSPSQKLENDLQKRDAEAKKGKSSSGKKDSAPAAKAASSAPSKPSSKATSAAPATTKASSHKAAATSSAHTSKTSSHKEAATSSADSKESESEASTSSSSHSKTATTSVNAKAKATAAGMRFAGDSLRSFRAAQNGEEGSGGVAGVAGNLMSSAWDSRKGRTKHGKSAHSSAAAEEEEMASDEAEVAADETAAEEKPPTEESTGKSHSSKSTSHGRSGKGRGRSGSTHSSSDADAGEGEVVEESPEAETEMATEEEAPVPTKKKTSSHGTSKKSHSSGALKRLTKRAAMAPGDKRPGSPDLDVDPSAKRTRVEDSTSASGDGAAVASSPSVSGGALGDSGVRATGPGNPHGDVNPAVPEQVTSEGTSRLANSVGGVESPADGSTSAVGASPAGNSPAGIQDVSGSPLGSWSLPGTSMSSPESHGSAAPLGEAGPAAEGDAGHLAGSDDAFSAGSSEYSTDRDTSDVSTLELDGNSAGNMGNSGAAGMGPTSMMSAPSSHITAASNNWGTMNNLGSYDNKNTNTLNSASPVAKTGDYTADNPDDDWGITAEPDSYLEQSPDNSHMSFPKIAGGDNYAAHSNPPTDLDHTGKTISRPKGPSISITSPGGTESYAAEVAHGSEDGFLLPPPMDRTPYSMTHHGSAPIPSTTGAISPDSANAANTVPTAKLNVAGTSLPAAQPSGTVLRRLDRRSAKTPLRASNPSTDEGSSSSGSSAEGSAGGTDGDVSSTAITESTTSMDKAGSSGDDADSSEAPGATSADDNEPSTSDLTGSDTSAIDSSAGDPLSDDMSAANDSETPSYEATSTSGTSSSNNSPADLLKQASSLVKQAKAIKKAIKALSGAGSDSGDSVSYSDSLDSVGSAGTDVDSSASSSSSPSSSSSSDPNDDATTGKSSAAGSMDAAFMGTDPTGATTDVSDAGSGSGLHSDFSSASGLGNTTGAVSSGSMGGDMSGATGGTGATPSSLDSTAGSISSSARGSASPPLSLDAADPSSSGLPATGSDSASGSSMSDPLSGAPGAGSTSSPIQGSGSPPASLDHSDSMSSDSSISDDSSPSSDMSGTTAIGSGSDSISSSTGSSAQDSEPAATAPDASDPRLAHSLSTGPGDAASSSSMSDTPSGAGAGSAAGSGRLSAAGSRSSPSILGAVVPPSSDPLSGADSSMSSGTSDSLTGSGSSAGADSGLSGSGLSSRSGAGGQSGALSGGSATLD